MIKWLKPAALALCVAMAHTASAQEDIQLQATPLAEGVYMIQGVGGFAGGNMLVSTGSDGVVLIDDSMPPFLDKLNAELKKLKVKAVDYLINTHVHWDHISNNATFGEQGVKIVAHQGLRDFLATKGMPTSEGLKPVPNSALPVITYTQKMAFYLNGDAATLIHLPNAHTSTDTAVHLPKSNILHTGDVLFNGLFPFIDLQNGGTVKGYLAAQKRLLALTDSNTKIVPGHGPLATKKDLEAAISMLESSIAKVAALVQSNKTLDEVLKINPLAEYDAKWSWGFINTEKMTQTIYADLTGGVAAKSEHKH